MNRKLLLASIMGISLIAITLTVPGTSAQSVPEWVKNTALWYGQGEISETEFLNAIKFLLENDVIVIETEESTPLSEDEIITNIIIPNGNANVGNTAFYTPLNLEIPVGTTVTWVNEDAVPHTVQSQDSEGNIIGLFNSDLIYTGERFSFTFEEDGVYNYYCSLHPWRVGLVTVR